MYSIFSIIDNRYIIYNHILGQGISKIYLGKDIRKCTKVAIKQIFYNKSNIKLIEKEIEILQHTNHPNIIKLFNFYYYREYVYLIFEYCEGGDLYNFKYKKTDENIKKIYIQIVEGLLYLKNKNIYHHDIKPHNILIKDNRVKIADFGFANNFNFICGSPIYMAPELFKLKKFSKKSDIWSLGIILYEMLNTKLPYNLSKCKNIKNIVKSFESNTLEFNDNISSEAQDLLRMILTIDYNERAEWNELLNNSWLNNKEEFKDELFKEELLKEELFKEELLKEELLKEGLFKEELLKEEYNRDIIYNDGLTINKKDMLKLKNRCKDKYIDGFILNSPIYNNHFNKYYTDKCKYQNKPKPKPIYIYKSSSVKNKSSDNKFKYTFLTSI